MILSLFPFPVVNFDFIKVFFALFDRLLQMYHKELKKNEKDLYKMMKDQKLRFERRQEYQAVFQILNIIYQYAYKYPNRAN